MIVFVATVGILFVAFVVYQHNLKNPVSTQQHKSPKLSTPLQRAVEKLQSDYPDGVLPEHIVERGKIVGRYLDGDIHETITLSNGWTFEWFNVAQYNNSTGAFIFTTGHKSMFILIDELVYKMVSHEQSHLPQAT
jgi:hypothetical protein